jgi:predicted nucleotidyltransferase
MQFRDRDIIRDQSNRIYVVLGHIQPDTHVICFLKYIPNPNGKWKQGEESFQRVFWGSVQSVDSGKDLVPADFIRYDEHFGTELLEVPVSMIKKHYQPEKRLAAILDAESNDRLEQTVKATAAAINQFLDIGFESLGVAGSILWHAHNTSYSDINMNVYGFENCMRLHEGLNQVAGATPDIRIRKKNEWKNAISRVNQRIPSISQSDLESLFSRRSALYHQEQCIGISPILQAHESPIPYGSEKYTTVSAHPVRVKMYIEDDDYGLFHPALYLSESEPVKMADNEHIGRLMVYDGAFGGVIRKGDSVEASGTLQEVHAVKKGKFTGNQKKFYQLMIGTVDGAGKEFIRLCE